MKNKMRINIKINLESYQQLKNLKNKTGITIIRLCQDAIKLLAEKMKAD